MIIIGEWQWNAVHHFPHLPGPHVNGRARWTRSGISWDFCRVFSWKSLIWWRWYLFSLLWNWEFQHVLEESVGRMIYIYIYIVLLYIYILFCFVWVPEANPRQSGRRTKGPRPSRQHWVPATTQSSQYQTIAGWRFQPCLIPYVGG